MTRIYLHKVLCADFFIFYFIVVVLVLVRASSCSYLCGNELQVLRPTVRVIAEAVRGQWEKKAEQSVVKIDSRAA